MPALVALGRRWQIATDDFVFPGFIDVLIRVSWLVNSQQKYICKNSADAFFQNWLHILVFRVVAGCIIFWKEDVKLSCEGGSLIRIYLVGNFLVLLFIILANIALVQNSMVGSMMDTEARKFVVPCIYIR